MAYQTIENFAAGLDTRKSPLTSPAGTMTKMVNASVTPGGEISKRRAFINVASVPGTFGLASTESTLYVFGRAVAPTPPSWSVSGVTLKGMLIPNSDVNLVQTDYDTFDGKIYLACAIRNPDGTLPVKPTDAQNPHYYDSVLTEGAGKGYYIRTYQSKVYSVLGKNLNFSAVSNPVVWETESYIDKVVVSKLDKTNPITCTVSTGEITQFTNGKVVLIAGATATGLTGANGYRTIINVNNTLGTFQLSGVNGSTATAAQTDGKVSATPAILVQSISNTNPAVCTVASGDIVKYADGMKVRINGVTGGIVPPPPASNPNANLFVISKVGSPANTFTINLNASGFAAPQTADTWATQTNDVIRTGMGFINLSLQDADAEVLTSIEVYYDKLAVFSTESVQIWAVDPDPAQNAFTQLLRAAGTSAPQSPLQYGSGDVLFLDPSGIRSVKAKDASNSAAVSDIGSPIDPTLQTIKLANVAGYMDKAISLLEPQIGRFWLVFPTQIMVLSYFPGPRITAWSQYTLPELGSAKVTYAVTSGGKVFLRDDADNIWVYGGPNGTDYNNCGVEIRLPYLDAKKPGHKKLFEGFDATVSGTWEVRISYNFNDPEQEDVLAVITQPTWNAGRIEQQGFDSHFSLRFWNTDNFPATISNCAVHYEMAEATD